VSRDRHPEGPTQSWLVRCWEEPREHPDEGAAFRCFVRNLKTGEERYLTDPREIGEILARKLREEAGAPKAVAEKRRAG
jgi:hypothetical protein